MARGLIDVPCLRLQHSCEAQKLWPHPLQMSLIVSEVILLPFMALRTHSGMTCKIRSGTLSLLVYVCGTMRRSRAEANLTVDVLKGRLDAVMFGAFRLHRFVLVCQMWRQIIIKDTTCNKGPQSTQRSSLLVFTVRFILLPFLLARSYTLQGSSLGKKKKKVGVDGKSPQESNKNDVCWLLWLHAQNVLMCVSLRGCIYSVQRSPGCVCICML